jgi:hypothetical protein
LPVLADAGVADPGRALALSSNRAASETSSVAPATAPVVEAVVSSWAPARRPERERRCPGAKRLLLHRGRSAGSYSACCPATRGWKGSMDSTLRRAGPSRAMCSIERSQQRGARPVGDEPAPERIDDAVVLVGRRAAKPSGSHSHTRLRNSSSRSCHQRRISALLTDAR